VLSHWPQENGDNLVVGVVGGDDVVSAFLSINGKSTSHGEIQVKSLTNYKEAVDCCHIIFLLNSTMLIF